MGNHGDELNAPGGAGATGDLPRRVLDTLLEGCQVISPDFRYLYVNEAVARQARTTREALLGKPMMTCFPGIEHTEMFTVLRRCMTGGRPESMENAFTFPDGSQGWFELHFEPVPGGVTILSVEITARKRAEAALRRTLRALATVSRCNQTLVRATDERRFVDDVVRLVVETGGYHQASVTLAPQGTGGSLEVVAEARAEGGGVPASDVEISTLSLDVLAEGVAIGVLTIGAREPGAFDAQERSLLEEVALDLGYGIGTLRSRVAHAHTEAQLAAARRLEALGRLAGGVAHDFNNLLTVILSHADFARAALPATDPVLSDLAQVREAGQRAAALTRQLLAFGRKQVLEPRVTDLAEVVRELEPLLHPLLGEHVAVEIRAPAHPGNVMADPSQMEQVIMNLAVNARDAMPDGGRLTIVMEDTELDEVSAAAHVSVTPGTYLHLAVTDTGVGMSDTVRDRIFEPFFTTKTAGRGTGLGLSTVYGIVTQHGGSLEVESALGQGTTFHIHLPTVDAARAPARSPHPVAAATGTETILLVEDDAEVRRAARRILEGAGFRVLAAAGGGDALRLWDDHREEVDLLITDVVMPEMSGRALADRLQADRPGLRVLFSSGYTDDAILHHGVLEPGTCFLAKPFSGVELTSRVRQVLDDAG